MKAFLTLLISISFLTYSIAQEQAETAKNKLRFTIGTVINAEDPISSSTVWDINLQLDYQRRITNSIYGGIKLSSFMLDEQSYVLVSPCIYSTLLTRENTNLILATNLGYAFSEHQAQDGIDWGGVNLGVGLENNYAIGSGDDLELGFGLSYFLQERKYQSIFSSIQSNMKHVLGFNVIFTKKF